mgnify:FL=1
MRHHGGVPPPDVPTYETARFRVRGVVQGVGFRPFVYRLGNAHHLAGWVRNDGEGVLAEATGTPDALDAFAVALDAEAPFASVVEAVEVHDRRPATDAEADAARAAPAADAPAFTIRASGEGGHPTTLIAPDLPICPDCRRELFDPDDRRYRYPYVNCTNCGPRWSIIRGLPYDRPLTTMADFALCDACAAEYHDPLDRRFHAQPVACPACGPQVHARDRDGVVTAEGDAAVRATAAALRDGAILAIKGLGGYHLACDARNAAAVDALRARKARRDKPFALMARDRAVAMSTVRATDAVNALLTDVATPIVLAPRARDDLPGGLAPESGDLGVMLPYTPLQHLLFDAGAPPLLVMTSANRAGEPIAYGDDEAIARLGGEGGLADGFLTGERPIARRVDDSVATVLSGAPVVLRRARGYAPAPVARHAAWGAPLLAVGAMLKNAVVLATDGYAFQSQHLGDLDDFDALQAFHEAVEDLTTMYDVAPHEAWIAHDLHEGYPSTRHAHALGGRTHAVQHHEAHVASVAAERGAWGATVLGFAFDGTGLGRDRTVWGGEILHGSVEVGYARVGHLAPVPLPGGDAAARAPAQAATGFLQACDPDLWRPRLEARRVAMAQQAIDADLNTPMTSSMGRAFDAVAALCGFEGTMSYEGQAAMGLEAQAWAADGAPPFGPDGRLAHDAARMWLDAAPELPARGGVWRTEVLLQALLEDLAAGTDVRTVALRFHAAVARAVRTAAETFARSTPYDAVVLSGGVWQNRLLHELATRDLADAGLEVWWNRAVPPGDGGVALGQAAIAAAARAAETTPPPGGGDVRDRATAEGRGA